MSCHVTACHVIQNYMLSCMASSAVVATNYASGLSIANSFRELLTLPAQGGQNLWKTKHFQPKEDLGKQCFMATLHMHWKITRDRVSVWCHLVAHGVPLESVISCRLVKDTHLLVNMKLVGWGEDHIGLRA